MFVRILAVLALGGLGAAVFVLLWGVVLCPVRPGSGERLQAVLRVHGSAPTLENTVRGLLWLRDSGRVRMSIAVVDEGMDEDTLQTAQLLCREKSGVDLIDGKGMSGESIGGRQ